MRRLCKFCFLFMIQLLLNIEAFDHGTYSFTIFGTKVSCMCFEHFFKVFEDHRSWRYRVMPIYRNIRSWFVICYLVGDSVTKGHYFPVSSSSCSFLYISWGLVKSSPEQTLHRHMVDEDPSPLMGQEWWYWHWPREERLSLSPKTCTAIGATQNNKAITIQGREMLWTDMHMT